MRVDHGEFDFGTALASSQRCFDLADLYQPGPKSILHVGLGAGNAPMRSALRHSQARVEVVEIDPAVLDVAREWFGFETTQCKVDVDDARAFLQATDRRWERITLDAFLSAGGTSEMNVLPSYFSDRAFVELVAERLAEDGLLVANLNGALRGAQNGRLLSLLDMIEETLSYVALHSVSDRTKDGVELSEHPDMELADEHYIVLASRHQLTSAGDIVRLALSTQGSALVDPDIVTFARESGRCLASACFLTAHRRARPPSQGRHSHRADNKSHEIIDRQAKRRRLAKLLKARARQTAASR